MRESNLAAWREDNMSGENKLPPTHPGEVLALDFLEPMGITEYRLAKAIGVPQTRISEIIRGKRGISVDIGRRLSRAFGMTDQFWINLQMRYDLEIARDAHPEVDLIEPLISA